VKGKQMMKRFKANLTLHLVGIAIMLCLAATQSSSKTLFHDDFNDNTIGPEWLVNHPQQEVANPPQWVEEGGVLTQLEEASGDTTYAIVEDGSFPDALGVMVKMRLETWGDNDRARAGVGVWIDANDNYNGYTWLVHERLADANMEFLNDRRAWANEEETFPVELNQWYWISMFIDPGTGDISGKIWAVGDAEPADWLKTLAYGSFGGVREPTKLVGLNGGSGNAGSAANAVSFDDVIVFDSDGHDPIAAVEPSDKLAATWGDIKSQ
jgi:hypothetical protein